MTVTVTTTTYKVYIHKHCDNFEETADTIRFEVGELGAFIYLKSQVVRFEIQKSTKPSG